MDTASKEFLLELLRTSSPSGGEQDIQSKWVQYIKPYAHRIETDHEGNVIGILNPDAPFKVLVAAHCDEIGFMVRRIDEKGFVYLTKVGGVDPNLAPGMKIELRGYQGNITGVIGAAPVHFSEGKDKIGFEDLYVDCGAGSKEEMEQYIRPGDLGVYKREPELLLNDRIAGRGLDNRTGIFILAETLKRLAQDNPQVGLYFASTSSEEIGAYGAYNAGAGIAPDMSIICDVTFSIDHPGVDPNKYDPIELGKGPALGIGPAVNRKMNDLIIRTAKEHNIPLQFELYASSTGTDGDKIRFTGKGVPITLISLPLRYMHAPVETASFFDICQEIDLLSTFLLKLSGKENLKPIDITL